MPSNLIAEHLRDLFEATCYELFTHLNGEIRQVRGVPFDGAQIPFARIDAGCNDFEVEIALRLPFSALAMTYPIPCDIAKIDEAELEDWICELSNRLVGKLKRRILEYGIEIKLGLPDYSFGHPLDPKSTVTGYRYIFQFEFDHEIFEAELFVEVFNAELIFGAKHQEANAYDDGDLEFF